MMFVRNILSACFWHIGAVHVVLLHYLSRISIFNFIYHHFLASSLSVSLNMVFHILKPVF
jgi:hypothetical protein